MAVVAATATVTDAGTVRSALLLESETAEPPVGAALVSVTVQVLVALEFRLVGLQLSVDTRTGATRVTVAVCD